MSERKRRVARPSAKDTDADTPRRGRPTVLDEAKRREVVAILAVGCARSVAALYVGCHVDTIRRTALRDASFAGQVRQAESRHEIQHLTNINSAAKEGRYWRAAAWVLERKYPDRYGGRAARIVTTEQVSEVLAQFAGIVVTEVPSAIVRRRILRRIDRLIGEFHARIQGQEDAS